MVKIIVFIWTIQIFEYVPNQFFVHGNDEFVGICSNQLLPFEPKGWLMEFRTEIQNKINC
jgi:hypothetical protein